jgi:hypothetical protein
MDGMMAPIPIPLAARVMKKNMYPASPDGVKYVMIEKQEYTLHPIKQIIRRDVRSAKYPKITIDKADRIVNVNWTYPSGTTFWVSLKNSRRSVLSNGFKIA